MELALSLGDRPKPLSFLEKLPSNNNNNNNNNNKMMMVSSVSTKDVVGFCMALGGKKDDHQQAAARSADVSCSDDHIHKEEDDDDDDDEDRGSSDPPPNLQLHLLPFSPPVQTSPPPTPPQFSSFPWLTDNLAGASGGMGGCSSKNIIGKKEVIVEGELGRGTAMSSPNSTSAAAASSSFQMDFSMYNIVMYNNRSTSSNNNMNMNMNMKKRDRFEESNQINNYNNEIMETAAETTGASTDEDDNNIISNNNNINEGGRKKLRLTKDQSAFLEDSFKVHSTLNPKQKQALAKQLNLRPRQVEVWFQNRRARTKLKQTEIDCEYLKRCCDKLTEENRKLQKELQELRALKSSQPFYMQLPATTLTMCPSCERVATTTTTTAANTAATPPPATSADGGNSTRVVIAKPIRAIPFSPADSLILDHHHDTTQTHISL